MKTALKMKNKGIFSNGKFRTGKIISKNIDLAEPAMGTLEVVVITGILLAIALIFNKEIRAFADKLFSAIFSDSNVINQIMR